MKILVIIVSYNFERWIDRCLNSLRQSEQQADVVVIDNASQDRTVSLIESRYPEVRLIKSKENLGFGRANNIGMKIALKEGYDAVFLLNQDAWIDAKVLGELSELSRSHPRYGILSPIHLTGSGEKLEQGFAGYSNLSNLEEVKARTENPARNKRTVRTHPSAFRQCRFLDDSVQCVANRRWFFSTFLSLRRRRGLR